VSLLGGITAFSSSFLYSHFSLNFFSCHKSYLNIHKAPVLLYVFHGYDENGLVKQSIDENFIKITK
jgi:hypothetical protein